MPVEFMPVELENSSAKTVSNSASGEASVSSSGQQPPPPPPPLPAAAVATKKKRNLPGMPDPNAEVIALSPKTLMATNRFVCEICSKGFQRDQNLQLHRRGHNLPWKLRQRPTGKEVRKRVYVCPEPSCVHHDPSRALGDLTGIKKHFCRKHGEKKWKCDKCSKKYAVQSDWKAHSKTCGTREYRCDCGTLFSRRDSFITHRAFCDALAEESARAQPPAVEAAGAANSETTDDDRRMMAAAAASSPSSALVSAVLPLQQSPPVVAEDDQLQQKQGQQQEVEHAIPATTILHHIPPPPPPLPPLMAGSSNSGSNTSSSTSSSSSSSLFASLFASAAASATQGSAFSDLIGAMSRANRAVQVVAAPAPPPPPSSLETTSLCLSPNGPALFPGAHDRRQFVVPAPSAHMSATALLQKAAQMGAAATNASLLRGFGLASTSSVGQHENLQENFQWRPHHHHLEPPEPAGLLAGLGLGLAYDGGGGGPVLPDLMMGPSTSSLFGPKPTTLDFLGLGMGPGGSPAGGLSAFITSIGGGLDVAASAGTFGGGTSPGKSGSSALL